MSRFRVFLICPVRSPLVGLMDWMSLRRRRDVLVAERVLVTLRKPLCLSRRQDRDSR